jgi:hypothetical protein
MFRGICSLVLLLLTFTPTADTECRENYNIKEHFRGSQLFIASSVDTLPSATDITCILLETISLKSKNLPTDFIIAISDLNNIGGAILRVSVKDNLFILMDFAKSDSNNYTITAITYPDPLKRIQEVLSKKRLPTTSDLTTYELLKYKALKSSITSTELLEVIGKQ